MEITETKTQPLVGQRIRRKEDPRLITGLSKYVDDIKKPGMLFAAIFRSPHAAARINSIAADRALALPGVKAVYTGKDVASVGAVPCAVSFPDLRVPRHTILATDRVYFVGHPIAAVVADDRYVAYDAVELLEVDFSPQDGVTGVENALRPEAPAIHPEWPGNICFTYKQEGGDPDRAFEKADVVVAQRIVSQRMAPSAMETRGVVAEWDEGARELTVYCSTQIPHLLRTQFAAQLGIPETQIRVIAPEVGGAFGSK